MKRLFVSTIFCFAVIAAFAQHLHYQFSAPNAAHHEAEIIVTADGLTNGPAIFQMSRSSPGRYAKHEFGKNVYNVKAFDKTGNSLKVEKEDADIYKVSEHKGFVKLTYTLYGNHADGTYADIDITGYHLNMPASFMWVKGLEKAPVTIHFDVPDKKWKIATQLKPTDDKNTFTAPNLQYFMDAPTKVADLHIREWTVTNTDNKKYNFKLALDAEGKEKVIDTLEEKIKKVVEAAKNVFGELPAYDYGTYTFIASINPFVFGDGMEHRNSTMITLPGTFDGTDRKLGVFAHEFFHCWNVERIRPKSLEPFDFTKSNMSEALWLAEGFTQYYGQLLLVRAGLVSHNDFIKGMSNLINEKMNTPGAQFYSPIESSQRAVFVDAGVAIDKTNYENMFTSYYSYGGAIALALDLELRSRFNKSLDDFMKLLWQKHGKTEVPYTLTDVQNVLAEVTHDRLYAEEFFKNYIYGHEVFDYNRLLSNANYSLKRINAGKASIRSNNLDSTGTGLLITDNTVRETPLYNAGADINDLIVEIEGKKITSIEQVNQITLSHKPGDRVTIAYMHRGQLVHSTLTFEEDPWFKIEASEKSSGTITDKQRQFRESWMDGK